MGFKILGGQTKFTNDLGQPLVGGQIYTFYAGTSTPQDTYTDALLTIPNTNPIRLDDAGSAEIFLKGSYRVRVFDASGRFIEEQDNLRQTINDADAGLLIDSILSTNTELNKVKLDTGITATAKNGGVARTQAEKNTDFISVKDFGGAIDGSWSATFQKALNHKSDGWTYLRVPVGTYRLDSSLRIKSKTVIMMDAGVVLQHNSPDEMLFLNGIKGSLSYATGYDGDGDIYVQGYGAVIDLMGVSGKYKGMMRLAHARTLVLEGFEITNGWHSHNIEINSSNTVLISKVKFTNSGFNTGSGYEAIQIDHAAAAGIPEFGSYDGTNCENIVVEYCKFANVESGVGTHSKPASGLHKNISVKNCTFSGVKDKCIRPQYWDGGTIDGNTMNGFIGTTRAIAMYSSINLDVTSNIIDANGSNELCISSDTWDSIALGENITIEGNIITGSTASSIYLKQTNNSLVTRNTITGGEASAIFQHSGGGNAIKYNNIINNTAAKAIDLFNGDRTIVKSNKFTGLGSRIAVAINTTATKASVSANIDNTGSPVKCEDKGVLTELDGKTSLIGVSTVSSGVIDLRDSINNYQQILVISGVASNGGVVAAEAMGWAGEIFRPTEDFINVRSNNGKIIMSVDTATRLTIVSAADPVRSIIGIGRKIS